jgi:hypothetical protein
VEIAQISFIDQYSYAKKDHCCTHLCLLVSVYPEMRKLGQGQGMR